jgi:hypothetical protein
MDTFAGTANIDNHLSLLTKKNKLLFSAENKRKFAVSVCVFIYIDMLLFQTKNRSQEYFS